MRCEVVPDSGSPSACTLEIDPTDMEEVTVDDGELRSVVRYYYVGTTGVVRATAEWMNETAAYAPQFPGETMTGIDWFDTDGTALTACPEITPTLVDGGDDHHYDVTVYDHDSDGDGTVNEVGSGVAGDYAVTRTTRMAARDNVDPVGSCTILGVDRYGRPDTTAAEKRYQWNEQTPAWELVEDRARTFMAFGTDARVDGLMTSEGNYSSLPGSDLVVSWEECGLYPEDEIDDEGRRICLQVPDDAGHLRTQEVTSTETDGATLRLWTYEDATPTTLLQRYRLEAADGRLLESGVGDPGGTRGNYTELRYATGDARVGPTVVERTERMSNGTLFSSTTNTYGGTLAGVTGGFLLSETTTVGTGGPTSTRTFADHDLDTRVHTIEDDIDGMATATTELTYTAFDAIAEVTEPDGQIATNVYDDPDAETGRYAGEKRRTSMVGDVRYRTWEHLRRGELAVSLDNGVDANASYVYDGLGRVVVEAMPGAGIERVYFYDDDSRVEFVETYEQGGVTVLRRQRFAYDGLGRVTEVCDKTGDASPDDACSSGGSVVLAYTYDTIGPFDGTTCASGSYNAGMTLSDDHVEGRLGFVEDADGATAYEYDALGRVVAVARHDGSVGSYSSANVTCTLYGYDALGALTTIVLPTSRTITYGYGNDKARPSSVSVTVASGTPTLIADTITYDANGGIRSLRWNGGATSERTITRDNLFRITEIEDNYSGSTKSDVVYTYDEDGDLLSENDVVAPTWLVSNPATANVTVSSDDEVRRDIVATANDVDFLYDVEGRRIDEDGVNDLVYGYDATYFERLLTTTGTPGGAEVTLTYDDLGQVTDIDWDNDGVDVSLTYGLFGEVIATEEGGGDDIHGYDHEMRRVVVNLASPPDVAYERRFRYGIGREVLEDFERTTSTAYTRTEWVWLGSQPLAAITSSNTDSGTLLHAHADRMGVPRNLTTNAGGSVARLLLAPFGNGVVVEDAATDARLGRRYAGQYQDAAGALAINGYRALIAQLGVYTSPDPWHYGTVRNHLGASAYSYVAFRPFTFQDPTGQKDRSWPANGRVTNWCDKPILVYDVDNCKFQWINKWGNTWSWEDIDFVLVEGVWYKVGPWDFDVTNGKNGTCQADDGFDEASSDDKKDIIDHRLRGGPVVVQ